MPEENTPRSDNRQLLAMAVLFWAAVAWSAIKPMDELGAIAGLLVCSRLHNRPLEPSS